MNATPAATATPENAAPETTAPQRVLQRLILPTEASPDIAPLYIEASDARSGASGSAFGLGGGHRTRILLNDLVVAEPDLAVQNTKGQHMINERLGTASRARHSKHLRQHLTHELPVWRCIKSLIEAQNMPRSFKAVACHLQLVHRMNILHLQLGRWSVRRLGQPQVQVLVPTSFKVHAVIAVVQLRQLIQYGEIRLRVKLRILFGVRQQGFNVVHEVPHACRNTARW